MPAGAHHKAKTHCPSGHEYTEENTYVTIKTRGRSRYQIRQCKECRRLRSKALLSDPEYRERHNKMSADSRREKRRANPQARHHLGELRRAKKEWLATQKTRCSRCPEDDPICLDFHHRDPSEKDHNVAAMMSKAWSFDRLKQEVAKCDVVCANCHRKLHRSLRNIAGGIAS